MPTEKPIMLATAARVGVALSLFILTAAAQKPQTADDDWTVPAIIVGIMVFLVIRNLIFGTGSASGEGGDGGCGGGCGGGD